MKKWKAGERERERVGGISGVGSSFTEFKLSTDGASSRSSSTGI